MVVTFLNIISDYSDIVYYYWMGLLVFSTLYSYYWDLKFDFGFL